MALSSPLSLLDCLGEVPDPRMRRTQRHELMDILAVTLCAVIGGADHWTEVVEFGQSKLAWFKGFLKLPNGIASHDTYARVFRLLDAAELERVCQRWLDSLAGRVQGVVAIDGKSVRGANNSNGNSNGNGNGNGNGNSAAHPLHIVSAWASEQGLLLGQVRTAEKSNEITAIPELLRLLSIEGCIVTIDAMGCHKSITQAITERQADYVLSLKGNHRHLHLGTARWFASSLANGFKGQAHSCYAEPQAPTRHGRIESRTYWAVEVPECLLRATKSWSGLQTLVMVQRWRQVKGKAQVQQTTHYFISSLPVSAGAEQIAKAQRSHWSVENALHWSLDVAFREDACQVRRDNAPANLACLRRMALTQLKQEKTKKLGLQGKRRRAGWDDAYMETVLQRTA